jgi:sensor c-di-GMP phosphodiesterase-like protein
MVTIANDIRAALDHGELFLEYLPTLRLNDGCCVGAEALIRWNRRGVVLSAAAFIPFIENTPLSGTITYWVIDTVAAELGEWLDTNPDAHIGINVPPEILGRGGIEYAAVRSGLKARVGQIILEITERGIPDRLGLDALNTWTSRGVRVALDDMSMSGANLALLARCNFGMIKLDRDLVAQLQSTKPRPAWLTGLESLLQSSQLQIIAEGVETEYQAQHLRAAGVQMAQGHFYSSTLKARALMAFYAGRKEGDGG